MYTVLFYYIIYTYAPGDHSYFTSRGKYNMMHAGAC